MSLGSINIGVKKYRLPVKRIFSKIVTTIPRFVFISLTGHTVVRDNPSNLIWVFNPATGHMAVEDTIGDRHLSFRYRDFPTGANADGHMLEDVS